MNYLIFLLTYTNDDYMHLFCGDFNAHTLTLADVPYEDSDVDVSAEMPYVCLHDTGVPVNRANQDLTPDRSSYGKKLVEFCINHQLFIFNGRMGEDCGVGKPATTHNTTIDYFLGSNGIFKNILAFEVLEYSPM